MNKIDEFLSEKGLKWKNRSPYGETATIGSLAEYAFAQNKWLDSNEKRKEVLSFLFNSCGELTFSRTKIDGLIFTDEAVLEELPGWYRDELTIKYRKKDGTFYLVVRKPRRETMELAIEAIKNRDSFFLETEEQFSLKLIFDEERARDEIEDFIIKKMREMYQESKINYVFELLVYEKLKQFK